MQKNKFYFIGGLILAIFLISDFSSFAFADGPATCSLSNGPSNELATYIKNLDKELSRIRSEANSKKCDKSTITDNASRIGSAIVKIYNRNTNFSNFASSSNFWIHSTIKSDLPQEFIRDYFLLQTQTTKIQKTMDAVFQNCSEPSKTSIENTLADHIVVMQSYQQIVTKDTTVNLNPKFESSATDKLLISNLSNAYGKLTPECINASKNAQTVSELSVRLDELKGGFDQGFKDWRSAWKLITGSNKDYDAAEKRLLKKELGRQGFSSERSAVLIKKLGEPNKEQLGVSEFLKDIGSRIQVTAGFFVDTFNNIKQDLYDAYNTPNTTVYLDKLRRLNTTQNLLTPGAPGQGGNGGYGRIDREIKSAGTDNIATEYDTAKTLISGENVTLTQGIGSLQKIHDTLNDTIVIIRKNIPIAEKTCRSQVGDKGKCVYK